MRKKTRGGEFKVPRDLAFKIENTARDRLLLLFYRVAKII